ncbi:hypothetical protein C7M84_011806 [Penaeus vannamei]|uniref:Uncharacterized protein n=1 Tax=Penaeus vannamei TaxID=6689 RepID=A0A423T0D5_PENVA|nr:hypothetical protein C7M84_011806 [Penaeus vannamei]
MDREVLLAWALIMGASSSSSLLLAPPPHPCAFFSVFFFFFLSLAIVSPPRLSLTSSPPPCPSVIPLLSSLLSLFVSVSSFSRRPPFFVLSPRFRHFLLLPRVSFPRPPLTILSLASPSGTSSQALGLAGNSRSITIIFLSHAISPNSSYLPGNFSTIYRLARPGLGHASASPPRPLAPLARRRHALRSRRRRRTSKGTQGGGVDEQRRQRGGGQGARRVFSKTRNNKERGQVYARYRMLLLLLARSPSAAARLPEFDGASFLELQRLQRLQRLLTTPIGAVRPILTEDLSLLPSFPLPHSLVHLYPLRLPTAGKRFSFIMLRSSYLYSSAVLLSNLRFYPLSFCVRTNPPPTPPPLTHSTLHLSRAICFEVTWSVQQSLAGGDSESLFPPLGMRSVGHADTRTHARC